MKTLLERAKGSPLVVVSSCADSVGGITLLSSRAKQIKYLDFVYNHWEDLQRFSEIISGPLPLLRTIVIDLIQAVNPNDPDVMTSPSVPLFSGAVNLDKFFFRSEISPCLNHFVFPNLTGFKLSVMTDDGFHASQLLDFLEASPTLQNLSMKIVGNILLEGVPQGKVVVLPNVEVLYMVVTEGGPGYKIAAHMSCPSAKRASFHQRRFSCDLLPEVILPGPVSWNAIARQYAGSPATSAILNIKVAQDPVITATLGLYSRVKNQDIEIELGLKVFGRDGDAVDDALLPFVFREMHCEVFLQASRLIRDHPQVTNICILHFYHSFLVLDSAQVRKLAKEVRQLFGSLGPLEELTIHCCDIRPYLAPFLGFQESYETDQPVSFPRTQELEISHPLYPSREECAAAIVELAKSQHARGVPFQHLTVRMENPPEKVVERLQPWVGQAYCENKRYTRDESPL